MLLKYQPYRVISKFSIVSKTLDEMKKNYPNAVIAKTIPNVIGYYLPGKVINSPTEFEALLFDAMDNMIVAKIPQKDGFDDPMSPIARSRKSSNKGKKKWLSTATIPAQLNTPKISNEPEKESPTTKKGSSINKKLDNKTFKSETLAGDKNE